jgi:diguanylate cyclase (GGDEF)-like protein
VLLPAVTTHADAAMVAKKLTKAFTLPFDLDGLEVQSGVSIGIAVFPVDANNESTLLKCADAAMYAAKRAGRNCFRLFQAEQINDQRPD